MTSLLATRREWLFQKTARCYLSATRSYHHKDSKRAPAEDTHNKSTNTSFGHQIRKPITEKNLNDNSDNFSGSNRANVPLDLVYQNEKKRDFPTHRNNNYTSKSFKDTNNNDFNRQRNQITLAENNRFLYLRKPNRSSSNNKYGQKYTKPYTIKPWEKSGKYNFDKKYSKPYKSDDKSHWAFNKYATPHTESNNFKKSSGKTYKELHERDHRNNYKYSPSDSYNSDFKSKSPYKSKSRLPLNGKVPSQMGALGNLGALANNYDSEPGALNDINDQVGITESSQDTIKPATPEIDIFEDDSSSMKLRPYQKDCIKSCLKAFSEGKRRLAVSLATGGGKTVIFSNLIKYIKPIDDKQGDKVLILVHRRELAMQALKTCMSVMPDKTVDMDLGTNKARTWTADIVVASIQTLLSQERLLQYNPDDFKLIIIDEAHHAAADSYVSILKHFGADTKTSRVAVVGFSATLVRHDGKALSNSMDHIVFHKGVDDMINDGWLCDAKFTTVNTHIDLSSVSKRAGDFAIASLSKAINTTSSNDLILKSYLKFKAIHHFKSTLLFGVDVSHIKNLCALFNANGIRAEFISGTTSQKKRDDTVEEFRNGEIPVLMNCGVFTEGTDIPNIDCILLARPTKSPGLLLQMIGRGLRKHQDKQTCNIIDFVSSCDTGVASVPTLLGLDPEMLVQEVSLMDLKTMKQKMDEERRERLEREHKEELDSVLPSTIRGSVNFNSFQSLQDYMFNNNKKDSSVGAASSLSSSSSSSLISVNDNDKDKDSIAFYKDSLVWLRIGKDTWASQLFNHGLYFRITRHLVTAKDLYTQLVVESTELKQKPKYKYSATQYVRNMHYPGYSSTAVITDCMSLYTVIRAVHTTFKSTSYLNYQNSLKYASRRNAPATRNQIKFLNNYLKDIAAKDAKIEEYVNNEDFLRAWEATVNNFTKGLCGDLIFVTSVAGQLYMKNLAHLIAKVSLNTDGGVGDDGKSKKKLLDNVSLMDIKVGELR